METPPSIDPLLPPNSRNSPRRLTEAFQRILPRKHGVEAHRAILGTQVRSECRANDDFFLWYYKDPHMNNNTQQPLLARRPSQASSSNSRLAPAMASLEPHPKRRRLTGKQPAHSEEAIPLMDRMTPPKVLITESASVRSFFQIRMTEFRLGALGMEPLSLVKDPLQSILERRVGNGEPFKLKVEIGWEAKKVFGDGEVFKYYMSFTAFKVPPASLVLAGSSTVFPIADFMASVTRRAIDMIMVVASSSFASMKSSSQQCHTPGQWPLQTSQNWLEVAQSSSRSHS
jgi:hypothetical protein